jgi:hypothetical protein
MLLLSHLMHTMPLIMVHMGYVAFFQGKTSFPRHFVVK